jgi:phage-related protein
VADNINLPNLVSHLAVNLDGLNGTIADASRQGSSIGAALGAGVQRELRDLVSNLPEIQIDGNSSDLDRDMARVRRELEELSNQRIGIDIPVDEAIRRINELQPHIQRLSDEHPNINVQASTRAAAAQLDELLAAARRVDDTDVHVNVDIDEDRPNRLRGLLGSLGSSGASAGKTIGLGFAKASAAIGTAVPLVANIVATLADVAPAAGVAVTGLIGVQLTSGAVKLAAVGMDDALSAALDPSKADDFDKALEKLAPNARAFAKEVRSLAPQLREVQQTVQNKAFSGLDTVLDKLAAKTLPILRRGLIASATSVNLMAKGVGSAAVGLSESGTLGKAVDGATKGMRNLVKVPGQVVTAVGQVGAAAAPAFNKLTKGAASVADKVSDRLSQAFKSGAMEKAINTAVSLLGRIADVAGNVFSIVGSIFSAADASGGGFVGTLQQISGALAKAFASPAVQSGLKALFTTMSVVAKTVAPLLGQALGVIAPVLTKLGPPVQKLVTALGGALSPIVGALGPVLVTAAGAVGTLVTAVAPLLPVLGQLVAAVLPALTPLLDALNTVFLALAPVVTQVGGILTNTLAPILAQLPAIIAPLAAVFADNLVVWLGIIGDLLVQLSPSFTQLGVSFAQLLIAATPLITALATIATELLSHLGPAIAPLVQGAAQLATILTRLVTAVITNIVIPAFQTLSKLLTGDVSGAFKSAQKLFSNVINATVTLFVALPGRVIAAIAPLPGRLQSAAIAAGSQLVSAIRSKVSDAVKQVSGLPSRARSALGGLGGALVSAGASLISGFISGIQSKIPSVKSVLNTLTGNLADWKGPKAKDAKILTPAGRLLIQGFIAGIDGTTAQLKAKLTSITKALPANVKSGVGKALAKATAELQKEVVKRDGVLKSLAAAQKKLDDLVAARSKAAGDITSGILSEANITTGHSDVNSVTSITVGLQQALKASQGFQANIAKLKAEGLRSDLLQQIADAGVEGGSATAAALAKATPAELKKINDLQGQLAKSATATGNTVGDALYGAGIKAAAGLVAGLKSQEKAIQAQMKKIAEDMLKVTKKVHKTHSPSEAFAWIGRMDGEGLRQGFQSMGAKVQAAYRSVAGAALDITGNAFRAPSATQLAAVSAAGGNSSQTYNIALHGTRATPQDMVRELSWLGLVGGT